ncbi:MAG: DUF3372 domain-containing protein, partial [Arenimonas sp.]|nr:DUF3372 domain-containing protein [Arenimonas sp.]
MAWRALALCLLAACGGRAQALPAIADCDAAAHARVLVPSASGITDARAAWLDARHLRWPGKAADARLSLHLAASDGAVAIGRALPRGGVTLALAPRAAPLPEALVQRWAWLGEGVTWAPAAEDDVAPSFGQDAVLVEWDAAGGVRDATRVQHAGALDAHYAAAAGLDDLGVRPAPQAAAFRLWAPTARAVTLCLYPGSTAPAQSATPLQRDATTGAWSARLPGDLRGQYYTYLVDVFVPGLGQVRNRVTDPYAISLSANSARAYIGDLDDPRLMPAGWAGGERGPALAQPTDAV